MKICIATERMRLGFGVDLVVHEQASRLVERGFDVTVLVLHADLEAEWRPYRLVVLNRVMQFEDLASAAALNVMKYRFGLEDIDLWILQTPPFYDWARVLDAPVIIIEYGSPAGLFFAPSLGKTLDGIVDRRLYDLYPRLLPCDAIVSISNYLHEWLPRDVQPMSTVAYLGSEHYGTASPGAAASLRASLGIEPDDCMILWVGRIQLTGDEQPYKGLSELLALVELASPHLPSARFVFAGRVSAIDRHSVERRGIQVLPNLTREQMGTAFAAADLLINLAKWEGFNLALVEAQYQGTPVLAYDIGPHAEVVANGVTGLLVDSPKAFFTALLELATDRTRREAFGKEARAFAHGFSWDRNVQQIISIIERCMSKGFSRSTISTLRADAAKLGHESIIKIPEPDVLRHVKPNRIRLTTTVRTGLGRCRTLLPVIRTTRKLRAMARKAARRADREGASAFYLQLVGSGKASVHDRIQLGHVLKEAGNSSGALGAYQRAAELFPLYVDAQRQYGLYLRRLGRENDAADILARALALDPSAGDIVAELASLGVTEGASLDETTLRGTLAGASSRVSKKPRLVPRILAGRSLRAARHSARRRDWHAAENHYRQLLRRDPYSSTVWIRLGHMLLQQEQAEAALQCYRHALVFNPRDPDVYLHVGHALKAVGRRGSALGAYMTAWRMQPGLPETVEEIRNLRADFDENWLRRDAAGLAERNFQVSMTDPAPPPAAIVVSQPPSSPFSGDNDVKGRPELSEDRIEKRLTEYSIFKAAGIVMSVTEEHEILARAASAGSDILFGDTLVISDNGQGSLAVGQPFDHYAFLQRPSLGAAIAVRRDLAAATDVTRQNLLTGAMLLRLVSNAHTITYLPSKYATIGNSEFEAALPDEQDLQRYLARATRVAEVEGDGSEGFTVSFAPAGDTCTTSIIVIDQGDVEASLVGKALEQIRAQSPLDRVHIIMASCRAEMSAFSHHWVDTERLLFDKGTPYGEMANRAAVKCAGSDALIFMDAGIAPSRQDWLDRLIGLIQDPNVGAAAPISLYEDGKVRHAGLQWQVDGPSYISRFVAFEKGGAFEPSKVSELRKIRKVPIISRHCFAVRRKLFENLNGFRASMSAQSADIELCCRLELLGFGRLIDGGSVVSAPDAAPRWRREIPANEMRVLAPLYTAATKKTSEQNALSGSEGTWTTFLPPMAAR